MAAPASLGPDIWWPDWSGRTVTIAASGPSQRADDIRHAIGRSVVVAINNTWTLAPDADVLYACDKGWWRCDGPGYGQQALREFSGLKIAGCAFPGTQKIGIRAVNEIIWTGVEFGGGGNSAFQMLNFSVVCGARRVVLLGVDCKSPGDHWHGRHVTPLTVAAQSTVDEWVRAFERVSGPLAKRGIEVINASRDTALACFRRMPIDEALAER